MNQRIATLPHLYAAVSRILAVSAIGALAACGGKPAPQAIHPAPPVPPLRLADPVSNRTQTQLQALLQAPERCQALLRGAPDLKVTPLPDRQGPGGCAITNAGRIDATVVQINQGSTPLTCPMIAALHLWARDIVVPAARRHFGVDLRAINSWGSYACRTVNNQTGAKLSEHARANAIDIPGFVLADGRTITVKADWRGEDGAKVAFLREVHRGGCRIFGTVLGPESDSFHQDHLHLDMAAQRYCR